HLALIALEKIRGKSLSAKIDEVISNVGFALMIGLAVFVFYSDFSRLGWIDKIKHLFG
ncbi:MAG: hypothetical protein HQL23_04800, partial [Candidatus Omnitrophica bacterium]|nr:hypothetical protein [Candidatus Omnitrophota bacterium]